MTKNYPPENSRIRKTMLIAVSLGVGISVFGSLWSLVRLESVGREVEQINHVFVPFSKQLAQLRSDVKLYRREMLSLEGAEEPISSRRPAWLSELIQSELNQAVERVTRVRRFSAAQSWQKKWGSWLEEFQTQFQRVDQREGPQATSQRAELNQLVREIDWASSEVGRDVAERFTGLEAHFDRLRTSLQLLLLVVGLLALFLLWFSERALRPLASLTRLVRDIAETGLKKHHKSDFGSVGRMDEVGQLEKEFRRMATVIFEREKTVQQQQHRLEEQNGLLRELANLNENVLSSFVSYVWVLDPEGKITHCNPSGAGWLGQSVAQIRSHHWKEWPALAQFLARSPESWRKSESQELSLGESAWQGKRLEGRLIPLRDRSTQSTVGRILVVEDRTAQREMEKQLHWAEHMAGVGRLSAQVAHEVRNPLHSIGLEAELGLESVASETSSSTSAVRESLRSILAGVERVDRITENYLQLTRVSPRALELCSLEALVQEVLATYAASLEEMKIKVDWKTQQGASPWAEVDPLLFEQAFGNLVKNSIQAMESTESSERRLTVTIGSLESGRVFLRIQDSGVGIDPETRPRLFEPFLTTKANGTGLGLSFVRQVMHQFEGDIEAVDCPTGACFELVFPRVILNHQRSGALGMDLAEGALHDV